MRKKQGFTLIEMLVVISLVLIMASIGVPQMTNLITSARVDGFTSDLSLELAQARSESVGRGAVVTVCPTTNAGTTCSGANWASGRLMFVDANDNGSFDGGETIIKSSNSSSTSLTVTPTGFPVGQTAIKFRPAGILSPVFAPSFKVCASNSAQGKTLSVTSLGFSSSSSVSCP